MTKLYYQILPNITILPNLYYINNMESNKCASFSDVLVVYIDRVRLKTSQ